MIILGIESTCDETGAAVVKDGRLILSNVVASSVKLHKKYAGVVPEVAAREQVKVIISVIKECLLSMANRLSINDEQLTIKHIDAIAVAHGPGLVGSLLVGVETAKALALVWDKPLIPVNHLIGHVYANWLLEDVNRRSLIVNRSKRKPYERLAMDDEPIFPLIGLIVSGGHTDLILMTDHGHYNWLGGTLDDAAGEAFDKVARVLGLGYPGGPEIERVASSWSLVTSNKKQVISHHFPRPMINSNDFDFSFSGLKTAVVNYVSQLSSIKGQVSAIAYEFQQAIVDVLVTKTSRAAKKYQAKSIVVGGGVAANQLLRSELTRFASEARRAVHGSRSGIPVFFPAKDLSIDNGAMIAAAANFIKKSVNSLKVSADPGLYFA